MTAPLTSLLNTLQSLGGLSGEAFRLACEATLKGTVFLLLAGLVAVGLRRASAALRHLLWTLAVISLLALPILSLTLPFWNVPLLPSSPRYTAGEQVSTYERATTVEQNVYSHSEHELSLPVSKTLQPAPGATWPELALVFWMIGVIALAARNLAGQLKARAIVRRSRRVETGRAKCILEEVRANLHMSRAVDLRTGIKDVIPFTCGVFSPTLVLPAEGLEWPQEQLKLVLTHELAHVKRHDCLTQMLAQIACALFWFHPLVWHAASEMRKERERACDDVVLSQGHQATKYGEFLVALRRGMGRVAQPSLTSVAMAQSSQLEVRMKALLDRKISHRPLPASRVRFAAILLVASIFPAAAIHATVKSKMMKPATGTMEGTIRDPSGATIPDAKVSVLDLKTHQTITVRTRNDGSWKLSYIPAGRYRVEITKPGFDISETQGVLRPGRVLRWTEIMQVGQVTQTVLVTAAKGGENQPAPQQPAAPRRIRVGGAVEAAHIIFQAQPVYPPSARKDGIEGTVVLQAVIGIKGQLLSLSPLRGPDPALIKAAIYAVRQWRYKPTLLDGAPVEVTTTIEVVFKLGHRASSNNLRTEPPAISTEESPEASRVAISPVARGKRLIRSIDYKGLTSVSMSDVQLHFQKDNIGVGIMSPYNPAAVRRAVTVLKEMLAEHGRPYATVQTRVRNVPPDSVALTFIIVEGPKAKAGDPEQRHKPLLGID
jgi:TonB family protein